MSRYVGSNPTPSAKAKSHKTPQSPKSLVGIYFSGFFQSPIVSQKPLASLKFVGIFVGMCVLLLHWNFKEANNDGKANRRKATDA